MPSTSTAKEVNQKQIIPSKDNSDLKVNLNNALGNYEEEKDIKLIKSERSEPQDPIITINDNGSSHWPRKRKRLVMEVVVRTLDQVKREQLIKKEEDCKVFESFRNPNIQKMEGMDFKTDSEVIMDPLEVPNIKTCNVNLPQEIRDYTAEGVNVENKPDTEEFDWTGLEENIPYCTLCFQRDVPCTRLAGKPFGGRCETCRGSKKKCTLVKRKAPEPSSSAKVVGKCKASMSSSPPVTSTLSARLDPNPCPRKKVSSSSVGRASRPGELLRGGPAIDKVDFSEMELLSVVFENKRLRQQLTWAEEALERERLQHMRMNALYETELAWLRRQIRLKECHRRG